MTQIQDWNINGIYNEACASEGHCPFYFGRDKEGGCHYFMSLRITDGKVGDVDISGITVMYLGFIAYSSYTDLLKYGEQVCIYISEESTLQQRQALEPIVRSGMGVLKFEKVFGVKYVPMEIVDNGNNVSFKMPYGEMRQVATVGANGVTPVRLENQLVPSLSNVELCHSPAWNFRDYEFNYNEVNRCATRAKFCFNS